MAMPDQYVPRRRPYTIGEVGLGALIALTLVGTLILLAAEGFWIGLVAASAVSFLAVLVFGPIRWLPGLALASFALVPITYTPLVNPVFGRYISPVILVLVVWLMRSLKQAGTSKIPKLWLSLACILLIWSVATVTWSIDPQRTLLWVVTVGAVVGLPVFLGCRDGARTAESLLKSWLWLGLALGAMAIIEGTTQQSFLGTLYQGTKSADIGISQNWSSVRTTTTLGHPLMNATFFAATAAYAILNSAVTKSKLSLLSGAACAAATVFTLSRSGVAALAVGLSLGLLTMSVAAKMTFGRKFVIGVVTAGAGLAVLFSPLIQARSNSAEGANSAYLRDVLLRAALQLAGQDGYGGSGAGTSSFRSTQAGMTLPLENSYAGVLVSAGVVGLALLVALFVGAFLAALRRRRFDAAAGIAAFGVQIGAYPLVDNVPVAMLIFGMLTCLAFSGSPLRTGNDTDAPTRLETPGQTCIGAGEQVLTSRASE